MVGQVRTPNILGEFMAGEQGAQRLRMTEEDNRRRNMLADMSVRQQEFSEMDANRNFDFRVEGRDFQRQQAEAAVAREAATMAARERATIQANQREELGRRLGFVAQLPGGQKLDVARKLGLADDELAPLIVTDGATGEQYIPDLAWNTYMVGMGYDAPAAAQPGIGERGPAAFQALELRAIEAGLRPGTPGWQEFMASDGNPRADQPSAADARISRIMKNFDVDERTAGAIVDGVLQLRTDDFGRSVLVNMIDGTEIPVGRAGGLGSPDTARPLETNVEPGALRGGTGAQGVMSSIINTITDAVGAGLVAPNNEAASRTLTTLQREAMIELATDVSGRPSNFLMEQFNSLSPKASDITEGPDRAAGKARETVEFLERVIARNAAILDSPRAYPPNIVAEAQRKIASLIDVRNRMYGVAVGLETGRPSAPPPVPASGRLRYNPETGGLE